MARVYYPNIQKPSQNKRESGPKEAKAPVPAEKGNPKKKEEGEGK